VPIINKQCGEFFLNKKLVLIVNVYTFRELENNGKVKEYSWVI